MTDRVLDKLSRTERRLAIANEERRRKNGDWGPWKVVELPEGVPNSNGWGREIRRAHVGGVFSVLERTTHGAIHLAVSSLTGIRPTWHEMQRIKNELAGKDATAVEVYPPDNEKVDGADCFHIWVLPYALPFSIWEKRP